MADRWGWSEQWDQLAIVSHTCATCDVVEETLVLRVWDPLEPEREVVRISLDENAARKLASQLLFGAAAAEWEHGARALAARLREIAARPPELPPEPEPEPEPDEEQVEPEGDTPPATGRCPVCRERAMTTEEQPIPGASRWHARCGAQWTIADSSEAPDRLRWIRSCPRLP
jgi:hypothetical protein